MLAALRPFCALSRSFPHNREKFIKFLRLLEFILVIDVITIVLFARYHTSHYLTSSSGVALTVVELFTITRLFGST